MIKLVVAGSNFPREVPAVADLQSARHPMQLAIQLPATQWAFPTGFCPRPRTLQWYHMRWWHLRPALGTTGQLGSAQGPQAMVPRCSV